ncbi:MAG: cytochrome C [Bacteroidetes bacterium]|nr:MAG: cytochrome C [Bacteroidota bacterium]
MKAKDSALNTRLLNLLTLLLGLSGLLAVVAAGLLYLLSHPESWELPPTAAAQVAESSPPSPAQSNEVVDGLDAATGFVAQGDYLLVKSQCTACHSSKLVLQNRATREGWLEMIRWMQQTQKLWDLGEQEDKILDYLATYYAPEAQGRRAPLQVTEWYPIP